MQIFIKSEGLLKLCEVVSFISFLSNFILLKTLTDRLYFFITDSENFESLGLYIQDAGRIPSLERFPPQSIFLILYLIAYLLITFKIAMSVGNSISGNPDSIKAFWKLLKYCHSKTSHL